MSRVQDKRFETKSRPFYSGGDYLGFRQLAAGRQAGAGLAGAWPSRLLLAGGGLLAGLIGNLHHRYLRQVLEKLEWRRYQSPEQCLEWMLG